VPPEKGEIENSAKAPLRTIRGIQENYWFLGMKIFDRRKNCFAGKVFYKLNIQKKREGID
jgi:hypothetical protein